MATTFALPRVKEVWKLQNERGIVFLESTRRRIARVLGGTVFRSGDWVERPAGMTWDEALRMDVDGQSALSPFRLELVFDSQTRTSWIGPLPRDVSAEEAFERDVLAHEILSVLHPEDSDTGCSGPA